MNHMLLIACSHRLHESADAKQWLIKLVRWYLEQQPEIVVLTSDMTAADQIVTDWSMELHHRVVLFHCDGDIREYDKNGNRPPNALRKPWAGRSLDRAMVSSLAKARKAGWNVSALVLDHDRSTPQQDGDGDLVDIERMLVNEKVLGSCFAFDPKMPDQGIGGS